MATFSRPPTWTTLVSALAMVAIALVIFIHTRHAQLAARRPSKIRPSPHGAIVRRQPRDYVLIVLGSGGHTKEMLMMMDDDAPPRDLRGLHRRYLLSSGDAMSEHHLRDYEAGLARRCRDAGADPGSYDVRTVARARRVHQPLWSTPLSALRSVLGIFPVLLSPPAGGGPGVPSSIYSNGPATGFFVGLAAYLLRVFCVVPDGSMRFVYIESWARISTLSVTGKLFYYTGIADVFLVQHEDVAVTYGVQNAGEMVFNTRRPDI